MYSIKDIANEINKLNPDLEDFIKLLESNQDACAEHISKEQNIFIRFFKIEIGLLYLTTHSNKFLYAPFRSLQTYFFENVKEHSRSPFIIRKFTLDSELDSNNHICAHVTNVKKYLPKYLKNKLNKSTPKPVKQIQPDKLSLKVFENYVKCLKNLTSTEAENYLNQMKDNSFNSIREEYMDIIFSKCKVSIKLQQELVSYSVAYRIMNQESLAISKYMYLDRLRIKNLGHKLKIPFPWEVFDDRHSDYQPFIIGITKSINPSLQQISYLYGALIILKVAVQQKPNPVYSHFITHLEAALSQPDCQSIVKELKQNYDLLKTVI